MKKKTTKPKIESDEQDIVICCAESIDFGFEDRVPRTMAEMTPDQLERIKKRAMALQKKLEQQDDSSKDSQ